MTGTLTQHIQRGNNDPHSFLLFIFQMCTCCVFLKHFLLHAPIVVCWHMSTVYRFMFSSYLPVICHCWPLRTMAVNYWMLYIVSAAIWHKYFKLLEKTMLLYVHRDSVACIMASDYKASDPSLLKTWRYNFCMLKIRKLLELWWMKN